MQEVPQTGQEEQIEGKSQLSTNIAWRQIGTEGINCLSDTEGGEHSLD